MKRPTLLILAILATVALPLAAQVNDTYVIPVSGNVPGAFGTRWMTQFSIFNPQLDYALKISVVYIPTGGATGDEALFTVPANSIAHSDNILADLFKVSGSGSLLVATFPEDNPGVPNDVLSRSFLVTSNTYNNSNAGTFGQSIPGIWTGLQDYTSDGISAVVHGIRNIARDGWRTNIGAVNLGKTNVTMRVNVYDADGRTVLKNASFGIPPLGHIQDTLPVQIDRGSIEFFVDDPSLKAVVFAYSSTIDQLSGDPTYQTPVLLASPKSIYSKGVLNPQSVGKKIDTNFAREVRKSARSIGTINLVRDATGYRIAQ